MYIFIYIMKTKKETVKKQYNTLIWAINNNADSALSLITPEVASYIDPSGNTALIEACKNNLSEVALALIATGESNPGLIMKYYNDNTALLFACKNKMSEVALALIATGKSNPGHPNGIDITALNLACEYNMSEVALALIATGKSNPGVIPWFGIKKSALLYACENNMSEVALALIATGESNPGYKWDGFTALIYACKNNMSDVALALIATGESNPGYGMIGCGSTALLYACKNKMKDVAIALIATGESQYYLITNASAKKFIKQILDEMKMTAFIAASQKANIGFTAENLTDIYSIFSKAKTQNAGKGTTKENSGFPSSSSKGNSGFPSSSSKGNSGFPSSSSKGKNKRSNKTKKQRQ